MRSLDSPPPFLSHRLAFPLDNENDETLLPVNLFQHIFDMSDNERSHPLSPLNKRTKTQERAQSPLPPLLPPLFERPTYTAPAAPVKPKLRVTKADIHRWCTLDYQGQSCLYWALGQEQYRVKFLKSGQFHNVYTFEENRTITLLINTPLNIDETDEKASEDMQDTDTSHTHTSHTPKWQQISFETNNLVLRILDVKIQKLQSEKGRLYELRQDNQIELHCLRNKIPFVKKITSFVPGGTPLPYDYVNPEDPQNQAPIIGWELCQRVNAKGFIEPRCHEIQQSLSVEPFLVKNPQPGSAPHLFQWLITQWKAHVSYMIETRTERNPLGKILLGDFKPDNIGFDPQSRTFVCIDLKLEEDSIIYLHSSLKDFLRIGSVAHRYVVTTLIKHANALHASDALLTRLQEFMT